MTEIKFNSLQCIEQLIVFDSCDWSESQPRAWIYGIVVGWDVDSVTQLVSRFKWSASQIAILAELHRDYVRRRELLVQPSPSLVQPSANPA